MKTIFKWILSVFIFIFAASAIYYSKAVSESIINAITVCINVIIPSLYTFMVLSGFIISSGIYKLLSRPFGSIARYIFRIPPQYFSVFLLSSIAGYPIGATLIKELYKNKEIDKNTAERMLGYCYLGGPAFFCGTAGIGIYSSVKIGLMIFTCILISNIITAFILGLKYPIPENCKSKKINIDLSFAKFTESIASGGIGILKICGAILFFAAISAIASSCGIISALSDLLSKISGISYADCEAIVKSILEISSIIKISDDIFLLPIITSLLSFGGICVIFQTEGVIAGGLSTNNFYLGRIISIISSYFFCNIFIYLINVDNIIQTVSQYKLGVRQISPIPSVFLLIMTILLLSNNYIAKSLKL